MRQLNNKNTKQMSCAKGRAKAKDVGDVFCVHRNVFLLLLLPLLHLFLLCADSNRKNSRDNHFKVIIINALPSKRGKQHFCRCCRCCCRPEMPVRYAASNQHFCYCVCWYKNSCTIYIPHTG